jgi:hypothetical protein
VAKWLGGWVGCVNAGLFFFSSLLLLLLFLLSLRLTGLLKGRLGGGCAITQQPRK